MATSPTRPTQRLKLNRMRPICRGRGSSRPRWHPANPAGAVPETPNLNLMKVSVPAADNEVQGEGEQQQASDDVEDDGRNLFFASFRPVIRLRSRGCLGDWLLVEV